MFDGADAVEQDRILDAAQAAIDEKRMQTRQSLKESKGESSKQALIDAMELAQAKAKQAPREGATPDGGARRAARRMASTPYSGDKPASQRRGRKQVVLSP